VTMDDVLPCVCVWFDMVSTGSEILNICFELLL
jgi:hypothetical protein